MANSLQTILSQPSLRRLSGGIASLGSCLGEDAAPKEATAEEMVLFPAARLAEVDNIFICMFLSLTLFISHCCSSVLKRWSEHTVFCQGF